MPVNSKFHFLPVFLLLLLFVYSGCSTIARFDQYSYSQATSIKVDALNIMDSATQNYLQHQQAVTNVMTSISKIYEYEKNRPKNSISEKMWEMIKDTSGHLYGSFIKRWQKEGSLDKTFIEESKRLIGDSFDQVSQLESGKIKPEQIVNR